MESNQCRRGLGARRRGPRPAASLRTGCYAAPRVRLGSQPGGSDQRPGRAACSGSGSQTGPNHVCRQSPGESQGPPPRSIYVIRKKWKRSRIQDSKFKKLLNSLIKMYFVYHKIHPFKAYSAVAFQYTGSCSTLPLPNLGAVSPPQPRQTLPLLAATPRLCSLPRSLETTKLLSLLVCLFWTFHVSGIIICGLL